MSVILERHGGESDTIIITDTFIKEETLDSDLDAIEGDLRHDGSDDIDHPVGVNELNVSSCVCNGLINGQRKSNVDSLLV